MRKALIGAGIGLAAALFALLLGRLPFLDVVELKTYDWRMRATAGSARASDDIVLVTIDEESIRGLEPIVGRWPWPRLVHASVLDYLARARPRVVLYDVLFTEHDRTKFFVQDEEWSGARSDDELARSARRVPLVIPGDAVPEALEGGATPGSPGDLPGVMAASASQADERPVFVAADRAPCRRQPCRRRTTSRCSTPTAHGAGTCPLCVIREERSRRWRSPRQPWRSVANQVSSAWMTVVCG